MRKITFSFSQLVGRSCIKKIEICNRFCVTARQYVCLILSHRHWIYEREKQLVFAFSFFLQQLIKVLRRCQQNVRRSSYECFPVCPAANVLTYKYFSPQENFEFLFILIIFLLLSSEKWIKMRDKILVSLISLYIYYFNK